MLAKKKEQMGVTPKWVAHGNKDSRSCDCLRSPGWVLALLRFTGPFALDLKGDPWLAPRVSRCEDPAAFCAGVGGFEVAEAEARKRSESFHG